MKDSVFESYQAAAKVHALCRERAREFIQPGVKLVDIAEEIEALTKKHGCGIAFPLNLSLNHIAAHYTPSADDETRVEKGDVLKVDIGVHKNGYIVDAAITLDFAQTPETKNLIATTQRALDEAFSLVQVGTEVGDIGARVEEVMRAAGVLPINNLSGHGVDQYIAHCDPTIPNIGNGDASEFEEGCAYAIEPFGVINGNGAITDDARVEIFEVAEKVSVRNANARKLLDFCMEQYEGLPFAERWLERDLEMSAFQRKIALRELLQVGALMDHSVLKEKKGAIVAQFETTLVINKGKVHRLV